MNAQDKSSSRNPELTSDQLTAALQAQMQQVGLSSFKALADAAKVSPQQIRKLRRGEVGQMRVATLLKLSQVLQVSLDELVNTFSGASTQATLQQPDTLKQEYQRLQQLLEQQRENLWQEFQQSSLQQLESWLVQWPTAAQKAQENPQLPAVRLLPLVRPVEQLLQQWGVEAIAPVGAELPYDPRLHQLLEGTAQPGDRVTVRYTGYCHGDKLLKRAQVSPVALSSA
ncbi:helix-turn-helix domain protein [Gloeocapsa sp. PCC 7428]|uniref:helix-turn-helix domain-containing protein n=1 Tax=Gloeocapsa sp. PCC 7428 TaxID=1173026 RepID=UPI0002A5E81E|nr:helix-turn-helix domain-containing protein [Gloeocapsa sp. PCC 7428]AFZ28897.1 helix-turn-helix domain protein [Gloeocapsa sp. PCC 7428]